MSGEDLRVILEMGDRLPDVGIMVTVDGDPMVGYSPGRIDEINGVLLTTEGTFTGHVEIIEGAPDDWRRAHRARYPERHQ